MPYTPGIFTIKFYIIRGLNIIIQLPVSVISPCMTLAKQYTSNSSEASRFP